MMNMFQVRAYEARTITWWYQRRKSIEFDPVFQRSGRLWSIHDKAYLIDSILNEYDFPKIYLADFTYSGSELNKSGKQFAVIDGKQRLEAIFDFIENRVPLAKDFALESNPDVEAGGMHYSELRSIYPNVALVFEQFNIPVMSVITNDASKINQLFVRMNRNKPLTGAEIRNAMKGAVPAAIRDLVAHEFFKQRCSFSTTRGQDKNVAAKILLLSHSGQLVNTKKTDLDSFAKKFADAMLNSDSHANSIVDALDRALSTLDELSLEFSVNDPRLKASGLIPMYFRVAEEHGAEKLGEFLNFWNVFVSAPQYLADFEENVDRYFSARVREFASIKRNPNDSYAMHRIFAILSLELSRFRKGVVEDIQKIVPRYQQKIRAGKSKPK